MGRGGSDGRGRLGPKRLGGRGDAEGCVALNIHGPN